MKIHQKFIAPGRRNRPATNPASSWHNIKVDPKYITIHNAWSVGMNAEALNNYMLGDGAANRPASWHFSVDEKEVWQGLPMFEPGFHAGDNLGPGNRTTIGIEICDYAIVYRDGQSVKARPRTHSSYQQYLQAEDMAARLCAYLIETQPTLHPYPTCIVQHTKWRAASGCPSHIRGRPNGWQEFIDKVGSYLQEEEGNFEYVVISGSYGEINNAESQLFNLVNAGFDAEIIPVTVNGRNFMRVVSGTVDTISEARTLSNALKSKGFPATIIKVDLDKKPTPPPPVRPPNPEVGPDYDQVVDKLNEIGFLLDEIYELLGK